MMMIEIPAWVTYSLAYLTIGFILATINRVAYPYGGAANSAAWILGWPVMCFAWVVVEIHDNWPFDRGIIDVLADALRRKS